MIILIPNIANSTHDKTDNRISFFGGTIKLSRNVGQKTSWAFCAAKQLSSGKNRSLSKTKSDASGIDKDPSFLSFSLSLA